MNKMIRKRIGRINILIDVVTEAVGSIYQEERDSFYGMPDSLQKAQKGEMMQRAMTAIQTAQDSLQEAQKALAEAAA